MINTCAWSMPTFVSVRRWAMPFTCRQGDGLGAARFRRAHASREAVALGPVSDAVFWEERAALESASEGACVRYLLLRRTCSTLRGRNFGASLLRSRARVYEYPQRLSLQHSLSHGSRPAHDTACHKTSNAHRRPSHKHACCGAVQVHGQSPP